MGKESEDSELALSFLRNEWGNHKKYTPASRQEFFGRLSANPYILPAIISFFFRPWFQRAWVMQEFVAGTTSDKKRDLNNSMMVCGNVQVLAVAVLPFPSSRLDDCISAAGHLPVAEAKRNGFRSSLFMDRFYTLEQLRKNPSLRHGDSNCLLYWLYTVRGRDGADPKDKIYSALGLADLSPKKEYDPGLQIVDYSVDIVSIRSSLVESIVTATRDLSLMCARCGRGACINPTWIPDWSAISNPDILMFLTELNQTRIRGSAVAVTCDAAKSRLNIASFDRMLHTMTVKVSWLMLLTSSWRNQ
jgi:hypothetical protein